jgi:hypothetical protein
VLGYQIGQKPLLLYAKENDKTKKGTFLLFVSLACYFSYLVAICQLAVREKKCRCMVKRNTIS